MAFSASDFGGVVGAAIGDDNDFVIGIIELVQRVQSSSQIALLVMGRYDDGNGRQEIFPTRLQCTNTAFTRLSGLGPHELHARERLIVFHTSIWLDADIPPSGKTLMLTSRVLRRSFRGGRRFNSIWTELRQHFGAHLGTQAGLGIEEAFPDVLVNFCKGREANRIEAVLGKLAFVIVSDSAGEDLQSSGAVVIIDSQ